MEAERRQCSWTELNSFWRDDASLAAFSPYQHGKSLIISGAVFLGILVLLAIAPWHSIGVENLIGQFASLLAVFLTGGWLLAWEMYRKGGAAAIQLRENAATDRTTLANEFLNYRISMESSFKDMELSRGELIARLQAQLAELQELQRPKIEIRAMVQESEASHGVRLQVKNPTPFAVNDLVLKINDIHIEQTTNIKLAEIVINDCKGLSLLPVNGLNSSQPLIGNEARDYFLIATSAEGGIYVITERDLAERRPGIPGASLWLRGSALPRGSYRLEIIGSVAGCGVSKMRHVVSTTDLTARHADTPE